MFLGLDHTGLAVPDLEAARALFASLGFRLTPRELLTRPGPDGKPVSTGAANHVFMLSRGYQELIAVTDPAAGHMLVPRIARYWGLHIVIVSTDDADGDRQRLADRGVPVSACATWGREVPGRGEARFKFFLVGDAQAPECMLGIVQHLTPDILRPPELLVHPNGATALNGCILHVADRAEARKRYERIFGTLHAEPEGDVVRFPDGTWLRLADRHDLERSFPGARVPDAPSVAAIEFSVGNMQAIVSGGAPLMRDDMGCWLSPRDVFGAVVRFVPAT